MSSGQRIEGWPSASIQQSFPRSSVRFIRLPFDKPCRARVRRKLGDAAGLTQFGINLLRLPPGVWSSQRHWHTEQDEFVYVLSGEIVLVTDDGEEILKPGDCAGFKAGGSRTAIICKIAAPRDALVLEIGTRTKSDRGDIFRYRHGVRYRQRCQCICIKRRHALYRSEAARYTDDADETLILQRFYAAPAAPSGTEAVIASRRLAI